ncbi:restriction endonuclease [Collimonas sp. PA-H2]|uniref:restriction endonuclease n=1 Tax=Collimonas sp. PA-H2 TaxID=1881062 RepID=UPI00130465E3|nr:restriction endonuclease [Collimonas sp. PA-H2]
MERDNKREEKERQRQYTEDRIAEVDDQNDEINDSIEVLNTLLVEGMNTAPSLNFDSLRVAPKECKLDLGSLATPLLPPSEKATPKPNILIAWLPPVKKAYDAKRLESQRFHDKMLADYKLKEATRKTSVQKLEEAYGRQVHEAEKIAKDANAEIDKWQRAIVKGEPEAVAEYFRTVLESSDYPEGFPRDSRAVYVAESKQLVIEYALPKMNDVVPMVKTYKYVKTSDSITESARPENQRRSIYSEVVAQTTLRCLWEVFTSDDLCLVDTVVLSGYVDTINPSTGKGIRPCLVTVRVTRDAINNIDLQKAEAIPCLRELKASFSKSPGELAPVRPILELNMFDARFVQESDVLSTLDYRSNLMDLTPGDFESLITNLFQKMGLDTKMTQASRDGGVDCVAFDPRPIFGGKVVIQAKRYKNTVGVSAVRDLYGTMQNEGASKGILVTTSGYGKAAFDFANGKPLELLDGGNLLYLLKEHSGLDAKIVMPDEWQDIALDRRENE